MLIGAGYFLSSFVYNLLISADGRTEPNLDDLGLAFQELGINLGELEEYVSSVESFPFPSKVPKYPEEKPSSMNFLKPGSKEILSRPIHVHEHLPPMYPEKEGG